jgi:diguanylate cyclase (GGDEF)-like protein
MPASPLPSLDLFTVKAVTLVTVLVVSFSTLLAWKVNRPVAGMRLFALGLLSICAGSIVGMGRLVVPGDITVILGNIFMILGMVSVARGIREFRGAPALSPLLLTTFSLLTAIPFLYWLVIHEDFAKRLAVISLAMTVLAMDAAVSMMRNVSRHERTTYWPTGLSLAFTSGFLAIRTVAALRGYYGSSFLDPVPIEIPLSLCADVSFVACAFGMLLASNIKMRIASEKMAMFDPLTNLPNRRMLVDRLLEAELRAIETGWQVGVIYLDLDGFKLVNDTLGHEAGDRLLKSVSNAMTPILRPEDCLARVGGDEFVVVVENVRSRGDLATLAARLKGAVESQAIPGRDRATVQTSCGAAIFPLDGDSAHDVMREADAAMYLVKRQKRATNQFAAFN